MSLVEDAVAARKAGLTYGQYMTQKGFSPYKAKPCPRCKNCGAPLIGRQMQYCSKDCRDAMKAKTRGGDVFV